MIRQALMLVVVAALSGCATASGPLHYVPAQTVVTASCVPTSLGPAPAVDSPQDLAKLSGPERYTRIAADYLALFARALQTEPVLSACK